VSVRSASDASTTQACSQAHGVGATRHLRYHRLQLADLLVQPEHAAGGQRVREDLPGINPFD
jgi:hypothetical protein